MKNTPNSQVSSEPKSTQSLIKVVKEETVNIGAFMNTEDTSTATNTLTIRAGETETIPNCKREEESDHSMSRRERSTEVIIQPNTSRQTVAYTSNSNDEISKYYNILVKAEKQQNSIDLFDTRTGHNGSKIPSTNKNLKSVKMAFIPQAYPAKVISEDVVPAIQKIVWDLLEAMPNPLPKIYFGSIKTGALRVTCEDNAGVEILNKIKQFEVKGIKLKVVKAKDIPKRTKMAWKTRNVACTDTTRLLKMLQRLNPKLRTKEWKVIDTILEPKHARRIVMVDHISAEIIKAAGYVLPAGIDKCSFKVLETGL